MVIEIKLWFPKDCIVFKGPCQFLIAACIVFLIEELCFFNIQWFGCFDLELVFEASRDGYQFLWQLVILYPRRVKCRFTFKREDVIVFLQLGLRLINTTLFLVHELRFGVELGQVVGVIGESWSNLSNEILLVESELTISENWILGVLISILLWPNNATSPLVNVVQGLNCESHLGVKNCGHLELGDKALPFLHNLPW